MPNPVLHWEIAAKDAGALQGFYKSLFDWHVDTNNPMDYGMVDTHAEGGINGGIHGNESPARVMALGRCHAAPICGMMNSDPVSRTPAVRPACHAKRSPFGG